LIFLLLYELEVKSNKILLGHTTVELRDDGIVEIYFLENHDIGEKEVEDLISAYDELLENKKYPLMHIPESFVNFSKEAKAYSVTERGLQYSKAEAYVFTSLGYKIIGNFYLKFNRPPIPTRLFKNKEDAIEWLLGFD